MKFNNILLSLALGSVLVGFSACIDEVEYQPAEPAPVTEYYFPTTNLTSQSLVDGTNSFNVTVARANSNGAATLTINSSVSPDNPFEIPSSVEFADGIGSVTFPVKYDLNNLEVNKHYTMKLWLDGIENTPYSYGEFEIDIVYLPWRDFAENESIGLYTDATVGPLYGGPSVQYEVKIQQHPTKDGIYRIVNPYGEAWPLYGVLPYDTSKDYYLVIDASNPKQVLVDVSAVGILDPQDGMLYMGSYGNFNNFTAEQNKNYNLFATLNDGIIKFDATSGNIQLTVVSYFPQTQAGPYPGNPGGAFKVVLPGFPDEKLWEEVGMCDFTDGLVSPLVNEQKDNKYKVLVEKSLEVDDLYRIVNPWGPESGLVEEAPAQPYYMNISVADPEFVVIEETETPFGFGPTSQLFVSSFAWFSMNYLDQTEADVKADGLGGKYKDGVITLGKYDAATYLINPATGQWTEDLFTPEYDYPEYATPTILDLNSAVKDEDGDDAETQAVRNFLKAGVNKQINKSRAAVSKSALAF